MHAPSPARRLTTFAALLAVLVPAAAHAIRAQLPKPDRQLVRMVHEADTIVIADVVRSTGVGLPDGLVMTRHELVVRESWKGGASAGDTIEVWTPGGSAPGSEIDVWVEDAARLFPEKRYALFLSRWNGRLGVNWGDLGALEVTDGRVQGYVTEGARDTSWLRKRVRAAITTR